MDYLLPVTRSLFIGQVSSGAHPFATCILPPPGDFDGVLKLLPIPAVAVNMADPVSPRGFPVQVSRDVTRDCNAVRHVTTDVTNL